MRYKKIGHAWSDPMKLSAWLLKEIPFFVLLAFLLMGVSVEVMHNRLDLLPANIPLIILMIGYLIFRH
jgi:hypothetical protein